MNKTTQNIKRKVKFQEIDQKWEALHKKLPEEPIKVS